MSSGDRVWSVRDVMIEDVVSVSPSTRFQRLLDLLWVNDVSALPVVDDRGATVGIVTGSDLLVHVELKPGMAKGPNLKAELYKKVDTASPLVAADVMTSPVVTVRPDATLADTTHLMRSCELRRLPVLDEAGYLVGIVSQADLLKVFLRSEETVEWGVRDVLKRSLANPAAVSVHVADGVVHLEGLSPASPETDRLVALLDSVPGVVAVEIGSLDSSVTTRRTE